MGRRPLLTRVVAAGLAAAWLASATAALADYQPGRGLSLLDDRVTLGGYGSLEASFLDDDGAPDQLVVNALSSFVTLRLTDRWLVFGETELENPVHLDRHGLGTGHDVLSLERLYTEWQPNDRFRFRVGKMLTPIGIWNPIHADPLVWSTSRPIATTQFFDTGTTGAEATMFARAGDFDVAWTVFGQATGQLDDDDDPQNQRGAIGSHVDFSTVSGLRLGASFVHFDDHVDRRWETTYGLDALWATRLVELSAEMAANDPDHGKTTWGAYAQVVYHARWELNPFVRIEYADLETVDRVPVVFGVAWKPTGNTVLKLEGLVGGDDTSLGGNGVLSSFSVLF